MHSGALGAGLAIFTRYPIISVGIQPYSLNGTPLDVAGGDWFVGKAAAHVVIQHPILGQVQVFNTHVRDNIIIIYSTLLFSSSFLPKEERKDLSTTEPTV